MFKGCFVVTIFEFSLSFCKALDSEQILGLYDLQFKLSDFFFGKKSLMEFRNELLAANFFEF